jgi:hypothetical protein
MTSSSIAINDAALEAARKLSRPVALGQAVDFLSGASTSANKANNYSTNAANSAGQYYQSALGNLVNSTGAGSPAAQTFGAQEQAALQPMFQQQQQQLAGREAAMGIGSSGAGRNDFSQLGADQSATLAGAIAPLYSQALGQYGQGVLNQAGEQSQIAGQGAGAAQNAYGNAINQFYGAAEQAGSGGFPGFRQQATTQTNPGNPYGDVSPSYSNPAI